MFEKKREGYMAVRKLTREGIRVLRYIDLLSNVSFITGIDISI